jgi:hypothetical protein
MTSLAKTILFGTKSDVLQSIHTVDGVDFIDEYGYTPLIECAIVNSFEKADVLLKAGANPNYKDLTGRTPLHWAADNHNVSLCELLLESGADSNAFSSAGEPVLVMPLLRHQIDLIKLFEKRGADVDFARDFIYAKLIGHRYELFGHVDILDDKRTLVEIEYEGFYLEFTVAMVADSLSQFKQHYAARYFRDQFPLIQQIIDSLRASAELVKYQHFNQSAKMHEHAIDKQLARSLIIVPVGYEGHAISFVKIGEYFAHCDRGEYGKKNGTVVIYRMQKPEVFNTQFAKALLYGRPDKQTIQHRIHSMIGAEKIAILPVKHQVIGNCSWANMEATIPASLFLLLIQMGTELSIAEEIAMKFYDTWRDWDKHMAVHYFIHNLEKSDEARKATKAAILAAVLFQQLNYHRLKDIEEAQKIMPVLLQPEFHYILKSYVKNFVQKNKEKIGKNLAEFLDDFGMDVDEF